MAVMRKIVRWCLVAILSVLLALAVLTVTGGLAATYRWMVRYFAPDVWEALGTWATAGVAVVTVVVAGIYAKQQVEKAQEQVREAQTARTAQERQAQEALKTQIRLANENLMAQAKLTQRTLEHDAEQAQKIRQEQAQPNVVLYTEVNPYVKQFIEIVVKNFGSTPAYNVVVNIDPPLKATPNNVSGGKLADVPIPDFPILAPGQEWRTTWDYSTARREHQEKWKRLAETPESELTGNEKLEKEYWLTRRTDDTTFEQRLQDLYLPSKYTVRVTYHDSDGRPLETPAVLDSDLFKDMTWVTVKTVHNLTNILDKRLETQNKGLEAIHRRLAEFGTEHDGIWIYGSGDDGEREYREQATAENSRKGNAFRQMIEQATQRGRNPHADSESDESQDSGDDNE